MWDFGMGIVPVIRGREIRILAKPLLFTINGKSILNIVDEKIWRIFVFGGKGGFCGFNCWKKCKDLWNLSFLWLSHSTWHMWDAPLINKRAQKENEKKILKLFHPSRQSSYGFSQLNIGWLGHPNLPFKFPRKPFISLALLHLSCFFSQRNWNYRTEHFQTLAFPIPSSK